MYICYPSLVFVSAEEILYPLEKPLSEQALVFTCLQSKSLENTVGKGEIARNNQFLLFPQCFPTCWKIFLHFIKVQSVLCKFFQFGRV